MIAVYMDEVGFLVRNIEDNGNLLVLFVGGIWLIVVIGIKVKVVINRDNKEVVGVFGYILIYILEVDKKIKVLLEKELYVDCGFLSK